MSETEGKSEREVFEPKAAPAADERDREAATPPAPKLAPEPAPYSLEALGAALPPVDAALHPDTAKLNDEVRRRVHRETRRSFLVGGISVLAAAGGFHWLTSRRADDGIPWPFRRALEVNEQLARDYFRHGRRAPEFPQAGWQDRVNGDVGMDDDVDLGSWSLAVEGLAASDEPVKLTLDAIQKLPRIEMTTELKCIEGWSAVVHWAGARFSDFMAAYPPATLSGGRFDLRHRAEDLPPYVGMETPDGGYFVGLDMDSMLHPQTLLGYEMNGAPLTQEHGAPLRLVVPTKYGVKNIKRIGTIRYSRQRPADYWAQRGYDWYIGL